MRFAKTRRFIILLGLTLMLAGCGKGAAVEADECLYVGDGGNNELEAAEALGMKAVQAVWYLKEGTT